MRTSAKAMIMACSVVGTTAVASTASANTKYASLVAVNTDGTTYVEELNTTASLNGGVLTQSSIYPGSVTTLVADMDGDGMSDIVEWDSSDIYIYYGQVSSSGSTLFGARQNVSTSSFHGGVANLVGDVDFNGYLDFVAWNTNTVYVELGSSTGWGTPVEWSSGSFYGTNANTISDVNGDGKADLVAWNSSNLYVELAGTSAYGSPQEWLSEAFNGTYADLAPSHPSVYDLGLLAWNASSIYQVAPNYFLDGFTSPFEISSDSFYGTKANVALDVNLDGYSDLVAVNANSVYVEEQYCTESQCGLYTSSTAWAVSTPFYGSVGTFAGYTVR